MIKMQVRLDILFCLGQKWHYYMYLISHNLFVALKHVAKYLLLYNIHVYTIAVFIIVLSNKQ